MVTYMLLTSSAEIVPGLWAVMVSCPELSRAVMAQEGKFPVHLVPQAWTVFNTREKRKRGERCSTPTD